MQETIIFLQNLLSVTTSISLTKIPAQKSSLLDFLQGSTLGVFSFFLRENSTIWQQLALSSTQTNALLEFLLPGGAGFLLYNHRESASYLLLGPVLTQPFSQADCLHELNRFPISPQAKEDIIHYSSSLPVVAGQVFRSTGELVVGHLTGAQQLKTIRSSASDIPNTPLLHPSPLADEDIAQMRKIEQRYEYSAALTDAIKQGNFSLAMHMIGNYTPGTQTTVRNSNPLRNAQNYCIVLNTQLRHALEESGIHPYQVDKLSNQIGLEIEQLRSSAQLPSFFRDVIRRYCRLVQEHNYPNLKPLTNLAVTYIKEHLADNLTVKDTAQALTVNANYLSSLFHQDMGMTFINFVNRERTNQAAALLKHTNLQIQQIASAVGYNNTSYFAKQFVRFQGVNPSHYREQFH